MPGSHGVLAVVYFLVGPGRNAVFLAQVFTDLATLQVNLEAQPQFAAHTSMPASGVPSARPCQNERSD